PIRGVLGLWQTQFGCCGTPLAIERERISFPARSVFSQEVAVSSSIAVNTIQVISAFVMFIVGYLALLLSIIVCFVIASFICMGATVASAYTVRCSLGENCEKSESG